MTRRAFEINKLGIERFTRELQQEFDKHPARLAVEADLPEGCGYQPRRDSHLQRL
jgi:hypothetical protein